jgi:hypothetical protein
MFVVRIFRISTLKFVLCIINLLCFFFFFLIIFYSEWIASFLRFVAVVDVVCLRLSQVLAMQLDVDLSSSFAVVSRQRLLIWVGM